MTSEPDLRRHLAERNADLAAATTLIETLRDERTDLTRRAALTDDHLSALDARASATERTLYQTQLDAASIGKEVNDIKNASGPIRLPRQ
jgi:chromosome segregation ATPase